MNNDDFTNFDSAYQSANEMLADLSHELGWPGRKSQTYSILSTVLHALRDRLPVNEAVHLADQLPMLIKGVYFEGWKPSKVPLKMDREEFLNRIRQGFAYSIDTEIDEITRIVLKTVLGKVSKGEVGDIRSVLPNDISELTK